MSELIFRMVNQIKISLYFIEYDIMNVYFLSTFLKMINKLCFLNMLYGGMRLYYQHSRDWDTRIIKISNIGSIT